MSKQFKKLSHILYECKYLYKSFPVFSFRLIFSEANCAYAYRILSDRATLIRNLKECVTRRYNFKECGTAGYAV